MQKHLTEFIGTFFLVLGIGLTGNELHIGLLLTALIYIGARHSGAHFNPAISLAFFMTNKLSIKELGGYITAQIAGAFTASALIFQITDYAFYTAPPELTTIDQHIIIEVLMTFILASVYLSVFLTKSMKRNHISGLVIGLTYTALFGIGQPISGAVYNPAISIGSAAFDLIDGGLSYRNIPLYFLAPLSGGLLASILYNFLEREN
jgi:glycerol uptake facilitator-like aquaporin